jgi:ATP-dependent Clp protease adaptor protein ClpS
MNDVIVDNDKKIKSKLIIKEPPKYRVIYMNDDVTTLEFVVETLKQIFNYDQDAALEKTMEVDQAGSAVVAVLPYEIAEQKGIEVTMLARSNNFPLQVRIEPDL